MPPTDSPTPDIPSDEEDALLDAAEAEEEIPPDTDHPMDSDPSDNDSDPEALTIDLQNDSIAHFDAHTSSLFAITAHPLSPSLVATGSGDDAAYLFLSTPPTPLLPPSYESNPSPTRPSLDPIAHLTGHTDSINALTFTLPLGSYLCTAGLDGRLRTYTLPPHPFASPPIPTFLAESQEVQEINWLAPCPSPSHPDTLALGASDGSVWVYAIDASSTTSLQVLQAYYHHTGPCTAGAWSPDGTFLATVSEDGSLYVWDPFGEAAAGGAVAQSGGQALVGLTAEDQRFGVEGGLYSVAVAPTGAFVVVGGAEGMVRVVGMPRVGGGAGKGGKGKGGKQVGGDGGGGGQAGQILASLQAQSDGIETLSFSAPPLTLLAAGSVDGSVAVFDTAHRFAVRRLIKEAHEEFAVVKVEFMWPGKGERTGGTPWLLTSCGMDGVVRRWDLRGGTAVAGQGLVREWRGHRGDGEGGGVLGFVCAEGRIVTAGDDGVNLVFEDGMVGS